MPAAVEQTLGGLVPAGEEIIIQVYTDLDADSRFANQWVGGSRLEIERRGMPTVLVPYSGSLAAKWTSAWFCWGSEFLHGWIIAWLSARMTADIRAQLYRRFEMLSMQFYDKRQVGSLISRVTRDSDMLQDFLVDGLPYTVINTLLIGGIFGILMSMSWKLTLLS
jgi:ABC-type multidrug transport system fused ATPase/permease subunit